MQRTLEELFTDRELDWVEQEIARATRSLELLLGTLLDKERERIRVNVTKRCLETLEKAKKARI